MDFRVGAAFEGGGQVCQVCTAVAYEQGLVCVLVQRVEKCVQDVLVAVFGYVEVGVLAVACGSGHTEPDVDRFRGSVSRRSIRTLSLRFWGSWVICVPSGRYQALLAVAGRATGCGRAYPLHSSHFPYRNRLNPDCPNHNIRTSHTYLSPCWY